MKRVLPLLLCGVLLLIPSDAQSEEKTVVVTGFGPWGWRTSNPSWEGAKLLTGETIAGHAVVTRQLEVDYRKVQDALPKLRDEVKKPAVVIHFGVGGSRFEIEKKARNKAHWGDDDSGYAPVDGRITDDGAMIYETGLPVKKIVKALKRNKPKVTTSSNAGAYLCEFTFYLQMYQQDKGAIGSTAGFIHVPYINDDSVTAESIAEVMRTAVRVCLEERPAPEPEDGPSPDATEQKAPDPKQDAARQGAAGALPDADADGD